MVIVMCVYVCCASGQCRVIIDPAMHKSQYLSYSQQLLNKHPVHRYLHMKNYQ